MVFSKDLSIHGRPRKAEELNLLKLKLLFIFSSRGKGLECRITSRGKRSGVQAFPKVWVRLVGVGEVAA